MSDVAFKIAVLAVTGIFFAGGAWTVLKQLRRDSNGLGRKINRLQLILLGTCPCEKRDAILKMLLDQ